MKKNSVFTYILFLFMVMGVSLSVAAQTPPAGAPAGPPRMPDPVRSPEVAQDGRVTFRLRAPNAKQVTLARAGSRPVPMQKDEQGVWSITTDALSPDIYPYNFNVDGITIADPTNPLVKPVVMGGHQSFVHVPGGADLMWEIQNVPRGTLHQHIYRSAIAGEDREYYVYTPPGYVASARREYPVLYLLHGLTDDATAWVKAGRANVILDNLINQGKAKPMIVVMPLGYPFPNITQNIYQRLFRESAAQKPALDDFSRTVREELIPQVDKAYRVAKGREARAIAGLSMGGTQSLYTGLNYPDQFGWIGSFSGAINWYGDNFAGYFPTLDAKTVAKFQLLWIACGTEDGLIRQNRNFESWLKDKGAKFSYKETPGGHTWMVWKRNLAELAPLLFANTKP